MTSIPVKILTCAPLKCSSQQQFDPKLEMLGMNGFFKLWTKQNLLEKTGLRSVSIKGRFTNRFFHAKRPLDAFSLPPTTYPLSKASNHQNRFFFKEIK